MASYRRGIVVAIVGVAGVFGLWAAKMLFLPEWQPLASAVHALMIPRGASHSGENRAQFVPDTSGQILDRPFPVFVLPFGEIPLAFPKDWVEPQYNVRTTGPTNWTEVKLIHIRPGEQTYFNIVHANDRMPPRSTHFEIPPLSLFVVKRVPIGLAEQNLQSRKAKLHERLPDRTVDKDGFWHWNRDEYVLVNPSHARPLDQPLIVSCGRSLRNYNSGEQQCGVSFYWTLNASVRYDFYGTDFPKSRWTELDQRVLALLDFLDGRKEWLGNK